MTDGSPVEVRALGWLGVRTDRYEELVSFFEDVLGLSVADGVEGEHTLFRLQDGSRVELLPTTGPHYHHFGTAPVAGFVVADAEAGRRRLEEAGAEILTAGGRNGYTWVHFRAPDGNLYELVQVPDASANQR
jgi:glyoxylase I family protein